MHIKAFALVGFVLAALFALAGPYACPHAETMTPMKSVVAALDADGSAGDEHQCHHNGPSTHHSLVAWVRPAQNPLMPTMSTVKHHLVAVVLLASGEREFLTAKGRLRWASLREGSHTGFADVFARNGRLVI